MVGNFQFFQLFQQASEIVIDVCDHAVKTLLSVQKVFLIFIQPVVFFGNMIGAVGGVGCQVQKKGTVPVVFDEFQAFLEENIGNIALVFLGCAVVPVGIIKVIVSPIIGSLLYTSPAVAHHLLKATVLRTEWIIVSQMPFTEHAGGVSVLRKHLRQQGFVFKQQGTSGNGMPGSYPVGISSGHQGAARGSAGGRHMKVGGSQGLTEKA